MNLHASPAVRALCLFAFAFTVCYIFFHDPPESVTSSVWDKAIHFVVYGGMAFLLWEVADGKRPLVVLAAIALIGALDEIHQHYTPGRSADVLDFLADTLAAAFVLATLRIIDARRAGAPCAD